MPVGRVEKVCFNAHRIFNPVTIIENFDELELLSFAYVENGERIVEVPVEKVKKGNINKILSDYCAGMFVFTKN